MTTAKYARARREEARRLGLCQLCPLKRRRSARPGRSTCAECAKEVLRRQRKRSKRLREQGLCDRCGKVPRTHGIWCEGCHDHRKGLPSAGKHVTAERRAREGLCRNGCGRSAFDATRCRECAAEEAEARRDRADERAAQGLCYRCGKEEAPEGESCASCKKKRRTKLDRRKTPTPIALVRCGACGEMGHKKSAFRCPARRRALTDRAACASS